VQQFDSFTRGPRPFRLMEPCPPLSQTAYKTDGDA
jgi:hypothetical protein